MEDLYQQPPFSGSQMFRDTRFLVVDCEMSGLDVKMSHLLSIGWVAIENGRIVNSSAKHLLIHTEKSAGESTKIHGLHDRNIAGAKSVAAVLMLLMKQAKASILVFHHAPLDVKFLQKATQGVFRCPLVFTALDTMQIEKRRLQIQGKNDSLRLGETRKRYGLPAVTQHNALADAVATAELLLAQVNYISNMETLKLAHLPLLAI
ncbi:3'-5' exonuclease [Teredinibacter haidensis]|uniref:3'-5' exonuclease n=1 Tax=Teredinibacter haidensis TaxID=2731755 RepID=UPI0009488C18|nr:3'-5' exonuclease [Teredinibacter haidensis]